MNNFDLFMDTVKMLSSSQGFYSRLWSRVQEMSEDELDELREVLAQQEEWHDSVDVVMFLES